MKFVLLYMGMLVLGYFIAGKAKSHQDRFCFVPKLIMGVIYVLVFVMGMKMGINEQVTSNLGIITLQSFVITVFCIGGSMLAVFVVRKIFGMNRYGDICTRRMKKGQRETTFRSDEEAAAFALDNFEESSTPASSNSEESSTSASSNSEESAGVIARNNKEAPVCVSGSDGDRLAFSASSNETSAASSKTSNSDLKNTLIILLLVVFGILAGYFGIAHRARGYLPVFDAFSSNLMIVLLCGLLFLVGFDLGLSGSIIANVKKTGIRIMAFPFAVIAGSLLFGAVSAMALGFSLKEGLAISAGFGWYTYAPTVIAEAGSQHIIASAASFMHNVLRETSGIVLIPVMARKFGYIESAAIPGVAAMDVCLPIVERACRQDTVVYSFMIGVAMNIGASVFVPFFINL